MMRAFALTFAVFVVGLFASGCDSGECKTSKDCRVGMVCDDTLRECVQCLEAEDCRTGEFCCRGQCRAESVLEQFCGCSKSKGGSSGKNCKREYASIGQTSVDGPQCLIDAGARVTVAKLSQAHCGCDTDAQCEPALSGGKVICKGNRCEDVNACGNTCGDRACIKGGFCECSDNGQCLKEDGRSNICQVAAKGTRTNEGRDVMGICVCSAYTKAGVASPCASKKFCCQAAPGSLANGCCDVECNRVTAASQCSAHD